MRKRCRRSPAYDLYYSHVKVGSVALTIAMGDTYGHLDREICIVTTGTRNQACGLTIVWSMKETPCFGMWQVDATTRR